MNFLKNIFGRKNKSSNPQSQKDPENTRLVYLLNIWGENPSDENYKNVLDEILNGNSYLLLPTANQDTGNGLWQTAESGTTINLTTVYNLDGLKVLGAFSDEKALVEWSKQETQYTAMRTPDIIEMCKTQLIDRIVINSDQKNMYVLERNRQNISTRTVEKDTKVLIGTPINPLKQHIIDKLAANFKKVDTIEEAYQYAQSMDGESSIVLGIKMSVISDNSRAALHNALNNALADEQVQGPIDIMLLETDDWLQSVRNIENSLFYRR